LEKKEGIDKIKISNEEAHDLKEKLVRCIAEILDFYDEKKAKSLYDELFSIGNTLHNEIKNAQGTVVSHIFDHIATTNYDRVMETYARTAGDNKSIYLENRGFRILKEKILLNIWKLPHDYN